MYDTSDISHVVVRTHSHNFKCVTHTLCAFHWKCHQWRKYFTAKFHFFHFKYEAFLSNCDFLCVLCDKKKMQFIVLKWMLFAAQFCFILQAERVCPPGRIPCKYYIFIEFLIFLKLFLIFFLASFVECGELIYSKKFLLNMKIWNCKRVVRWNRLLSRVPHKYHNKQEQTG